VTIDEIKETESIVLFGIPRALRETFKLHYKVIKNPNFKYSIGLRKM
jgi:hypothetical protein